MKTEMSGKRKGQLTVSGQWARHLRPLLRRVFWKGERQAGKALVRDGDGTGQPEPGADDASTTGAGEAPSSGGRRGQGTP